MKYLYLILLLYVLNSQSFTQEMAKSGFSITIENPIDIERTDELITIPSEVLNEKFSGFNPNVLSLFDGESEIPFQYDEQSGNLLFVIDLPPSGSKEITAVHDQNEGAEKFFTSRAYAEISMKNDYEYVNGKYSGGSFKNYKRIRIPDDHTDHNALFRYEGPGWESDKVGYRLYIDWRNRVDIFGKKTNDLVLRNVGINDLEASDDSYHKMQDWGMDIFKVGKSLGIGSYAMMIGDSVHMVSVRDSVICTISSNGPVKASVTIEYFGWLTDKKYDLTTVMSITAGSRLTKVELNLYDQAKIVTGLAKHELAEFIELKSPSGWSCFALYGRQALSDDNLGIALFYRNEDAVSTGEAADSYIVTLNLNDHNLTYYFCAAWEQEPQGISSKDEFINYLAKTISKLNNPVTVTF